MTSRALADLALIARMRRDRDLRDTAAATAHIARIDGELERLAQVRAGAFRSACEAPDPSGWSRFDRFDGLVRDRRAALLQGRAAGMAEADAALAAARTSFARSSVLDRLVRDEARAAALRRGKAR